MEIEHDQFIGYYKNALPIEVCNRFIEWYDLIERTGVAISSDIDNPLMRTKDMRDDSVVHIPGGLTHEMFPVNSDGFKQLWPIITSCYIDYKEKYHINFPVSANNYKIHSVLPTQGYHTWHFETIPDLNRAMTWMICLQAAEEGGETEFLFQSKRIKLDVGSLLIWPAGYTHKHRGNPPLKGRKIYMTGWFHLSSNWEVPNNNDKKSREESE